MSQKIPERASLPVPEAGMSSGLVAWAAAGFSLVWAAGVGFYLWAGLSPAGWTGMLMTALVVAMPLALVWFTVSALNAIRALRAEATRLQAAVESMRVSHSSSQHQVQAATGMRPTESRAERRTETAQSGSSGSFATRRDSNLTVPSADRKTTFAAPRPAALGEEQPGLALGTPTDEPSAPLVMADFVRAIHFPEDPDDAAGFRALRLALSDRISAKLIRAAQDVLTLLAQEGIYMDELNPDRARPELWRKFAAGERGRAIAGLGGIRDRSCITLTASRMREDIVFRDAAHHFLRSFDKAIAAIEPRASDSELSALSDTRTARAFMLFGRVTGTFD
ncbi:MAG: hypothetical protein ACOH2H_07995 [Cypionkella sp.]